VYDDEVTMTHFAQFARVFAQLAAYRGELMAEAARKGWPLMRPMAAHYAYDPQVLGVFLTHHRGNPKPTPCIIDFKP
jgi:alpha-glucosidase (family GH31 glycosyl hydrolase)